MAVKGVRGDGRRIVRYIYDHWIGVDGKLYVKATAVEYERANEDSFALGIRRRMRTECERLGVGRAFANGIGAIEQWDVARNWADLLPEAYTYRTTKVLPQHVLAEHGLAESA